MGDNIGDSITIGKHHLQRSPATEKFIKTAKELDGNGKDLTPDEEAVADKALTDCNEDVVCAEQMLRQNILNGIRPPHVLTYSDVAEMNGLIKETAGKKSFMDNKDDDFIKAIIQTKKALALELSRPTDISLINDFDGIKALEIKGAKNISRPESVGQMTLVDHLTIDYV